MASWIAIGCRPALTVAVIGDVDDDVVRSLSLFVPMATALAMNALSSARTL
jgi:hypothetical protein